MVAIGIFALRIRIRRWNPAANVLAGGFGSAVSTAGGVRDYETGYEGSLDLSVGVWWAHQGCFA